MKRILVLALLALGLTIVVAPAATPAGPDDARGPLCSNITNGDGGYSDAGVVDFAVFLQAPACSFVDYSFFVTDTGGNALTPITATQDANCTPETPDGGCTHFVVDLGSNGPTTICVSATSIQSHVADVAPNLSLTACLVKGAGGATGGFG
jgi:hypothetical protein